MNILRIAKHLLPHYGGMQYHIFELSKAQLRQGHTVHICFFRGTVEHTSGISYQPVKVPWIASRLSSNVLQSFFFGKRLYATIKREPAKYSHIDVVHAHGDFLEAYWGHKISELLKVPFIMTVHGGLNTSRVLRRHIRAAFKKVNTIIVVAQHIKDQLLQLGISSRHIIVRSSGVNFDRIQKTAGRPPRTEVRFLFVGRLDQVKGLEFLIQAFRSLPASPTTPLRLILVGDGPREKYLRALAQGSPAITFTGRKDREQVYPYLRTSHVFVLPSIDQKGQQEGTPTTLLEAMAAGLPIITTNAGGIPYLVNTKNGIIVQQKSVPALQKGLQRYLELAHSATLRKMITHNRAIARSRDWDIVAAFIERLYEKK